MLMYDLLYLLADLRTAFDLLDRNRDGRVTANELQFMLKNLGINVRDEIIHDLIREASHSGKCHHLRQDGFNTSNNGNNHNIRKWAISYKCCHKAKQEFVVSRRIWVYVCVSVAGCACKCVRVLSYIHI